jgi:translation initiation factor 5B
MTDSSNLTKKIKIRTPFCTVLGHVDVGKTKLLDYMRNTKTEEASGITQQIGSTLFSRDRLETLVGDNLKTKMSIDSILVIDTPGHECFDMIKTVAASVADVVILLIDIIKGIEKQTIYVINLLKSRDISFIICLNKMDKIYGWNKYLKDDAINNFDNDHKLNLSSVLKRQNNEVKERYDKYIQNIINSLYEYDINSCLYYKNNHPESIINIGPISAQMGEGIPDLIMLISSMAERRYFQDKLIDHDIVHGYILDSQYDKNNGKYWVSLHRNGQLKKDDTIIINEKEYRVKYILLQSDNKEIRDDNRFMRIDEIDRPMGYGIILESENSETDIINGSRYILKNQYDVMIDKLDLMKIDQTNYEESWKQYICEKGEPGIQIIAPSYLMMNGLIQTLLSGAKNKKLIERFKIGTIDKKDLIISGKWTNKSDKKEEMINMKKYSIILFFDPSIESLEEESSFKDIMEHAIKNKVKIIHSNVVYKLIEEYENYLKDVEQQVESAKNNGASATLNILKQYIFRTSDPIIFGVSIKTGIIKIGDRVFSDRERKSLIGKIESIQKEKKTLDLANIGDEVCIKVSSKKTLGSDFLDNAVLYVF